MDYLTCAFCKEKFETFSSFATCQGCNQSWCNICFHLNGVSRFIYNNQPRCTLCFRTKPIKITQELLLSYTLRKFNTNYDAIEREMRQLPEYSTSVNRYMCTSATKHICANTECKFIGLSAPYKMRGDKFPKDGVRGICCRARFENEKDYCEVCKESSTRQIDYD